MHPDIQTIELIGDRYDYILKQELIYEQLNKAYFYGKYIKLKYTDKATEYMILPIYGGHELISNSILD